MSQPWVYCDALLSRYIDQGRNPQLYTKECLERALAKNEQVKGKIDTMKVSQEGAASAHGHGHGAPSKCADRLSTASGVLSTASQREVLACVIVTLNISRSPEENKTQIDSLTVKQG